MPDALIQGNVQRTPRQVIKEQILDEASQEFLEVGLLGNGSPSPYPPQYTILLTDGHVKVVYQTLLCKAIYKRVWEQPEHRITSGTATKRTLRD